MREKMVALIRQIVIPYWAEQIADHLISNGVAAVVRCKDCGYFYHSVSSFRDGRCAYHGNFDGDPCVDLDAFCSYGERKDGDST